MNWNDEGDVLLAIMEDLLAGNFELEEQRTGEQTPTISTEQPLQTGS